jgi:hypothetical protein
MAHNQIKTKKAIIKTQGKSSISRMMVIPPKTIMLGVQMIHLVLKSLVGL